MTPFLALTLGLLLQPGPDVPNWTSESLAAAIVQAHGGDVWPEVTRLRFTFNVEDEGTLRFSAAHDWDLRSGVCAVTIGDRTISTNVYASGPRVGDELEAFKRWTNDAYWLLMPLKLQDGGVRFSPLITTRDLPPSRGRMTMSFDGVGLTPGDQYDLAINLRTLRIEQWTYRPNAESSAAFSWENYQDFNGLVLSTEHRSEDGKRRIYFTDVAVEHGQ